MKEIIDWEKIKGQYPIGTLIQGTVEHHASFGIFLTLDHPTVKGLVEIVEFLDEGIMSANNYPAIGEEVTGIVLDYTEGNHQIRLSLKPSKLRSIKMV